MTVPNGSICFSGLNVTRPSRHAVSSPRRRATNPCAASWNVTAKMTGRIQVVASRTMFAYCAAAFMPSPAAAIPPAISSAKRRSALAARLCQNRLPRPGAGATQFLAAGDAGLRLRRQGPGGGDDFPHLGHVAVAVQHQIATGVERALCTLGETAGKRTHRDIVRDQHAVEADFPPDHAADHSRRQCCRRGGVDRRIDDMRGHRPGHVGKRPKRREILRPQHGKRVIDARQGFVAVIAGAAVPRNVLDDRQDPAVKQAVADRPSERRDAGRIGAPGAVADDRIGAGKRQVENRRGIDGDAEFGEIVGDQPRRQTRRFARNRIGTRRDFRRGRIGAPMRRAQARDPAALLVDQHRRVGPAHRLAQRRHQRADLLAADAIAPEQHKAERVARGEKPQFVGARPLAGNAENDGERRPAGALRCCFIAPRVTGQRCTPDYAASSRCTAARPPHHPAVRP